MNTTNFVTSYERNFDITPCIHWVQNYWWLSIVASILYTIGIRTMENSKLHIHRDQVRLPLLLWNGFLAAFSIVGTIRTVPELVDVFYQKGWVDSVCSVTYAQSNVVSFWYHYWGWAKLWELGDTVFVILRGRKVIFLHWYHHVTVLVVVWHSATEYPAALLRWFVCMNFAVHALMYTYYAVQTMDICRMPKLISQTLTLLQISQMFVASSATVTVLWAKYANVPCPQSNLNLAMCIGMYFSYLALFSKFFYDAYLKPDRKSAYDKLQEEKRKLYMFPSKKTE